MAYTTDRTWVDAEIPTAALFHAHLRDNMKWLSTDKPMFRGYRSTAQSLTSGTEADIALTSESFDNGAMHSTTTNTERVTIVTAGTYLFGASFDFFGNTTGVRLVAVRLNGTTHLAEDTQQAPSGQFGVGVTTLYALSAADYFTARAYQNSGGLLDVADGATNGQVWALWVGV